MRSSLALARISEEAEMKRKPCPFCGSTHIKTRRLSETLGHPTGELDFYKHCQDCDACGPLGVRPTSADALWNDRVSDTNAADTPVTVQRRSPISAQSS
jgi:Lar family restriction alleviation protein